MSLEDQKRQQLSAPAQPPPPPPYQHLRRKYRYKNLVDLALKTLSRPRCYCIILLITSFLLGYLSHSQPSLLSDQSPPTKMIANGDLAAVTDKQQHFSSSTPCIAPPAVPPPPPTPTLDSSSAKDDDVAAHNSFPQRCGPPLPSPSIRQTIIDRVFNGVSPWEGFPPPHVASLLLQEWTKGWGSRAAVFEHLITQVRPKTIIEVGTFLGASAIHMAGLTRKLGLQDTQILCIDDFRGWPGFSDQEKTVKMVNGDSLLLYQFMHNVVKANSTQSILFLPFSTSTALYGLCDWGVHGDLVEIDAAHDFHSAWVDINNGYKVLKKPGGVLFGHDYVWPGVRKAVHVFAKLHGFRVRLDGEHWILY